MSNSSVTSYEVARNARLEAARREAALREIKATQEHLAALRNRARGLGIVIPAQPIRPEATLTSSRDAQTYLEGLRSHAEEAQTSISRAQVERELRSITAIVKQCVTRLPEQIREVPSAPFGNLAARRSNGDSIVAEIERLIGVETIPATALPELRQFAAKARSATDARELRVLLVAMRERIASAQRRERTRVSEVRQAQELLDSARGLRSDDLEACRAKLETVVAGDRPLTRDLFEEASSTIALARKHADREYVGAVVSDRLRELGYEVDAQVRTLFVEGGLLHLRKSGTGDADDHAIELEIQPDAGRMSAHVLRVGDPMRPLTELERRASAHRQDEWCGHLAELIEAFEGSDIRYRIDELIDPDGSNVAIVARQELSTRPRKRRRADEAARAMAARPTRRE